MRERRLMVPLPACVTPSKFMEIMAAQSALYAQAPSGSLLTRHPTSFKLRIRGHESLSFRVCAQALANHVRPASPSFLTSEAPWHRNASAEWMAREALHQGSLIDTVSLPYLPDL